MLSVVRGTCSTTAAGSVSCLSTGADGESGGGAGRALFGRATQRGMHTNDRRYGPLQARGTPGASLSASPSAVGTDQW